MMGQPGTALGQPKRRGVSHPFGQWWRGFSRKRDRWDSENMSTTQETKKKGEKEKGNKKGFCCPARLACPAKAQKITQWQHSARIARTVSPHVRAGARATFGQRPAPWALSVRFAIVRGRHVRGLGRG